MVFPDFVTQKKVPKTGIVSNLSFYRLIIWYLHYMFIIDKFY